MQFKGEVTNQTRENDEKPNFGQYFGPNLNAKKFFMGFTSVRS